MIIAAASPHIIAAGAVCFGVVIGYVTYRTLAREKDAAITDLAAVVSAVGGGAVLKAFATGDSFYYYGIGLLVGMVIYFLVALLLPGQTGGGTLAARARKTFLPDQK